MAGRELNSSQKELMDEIVRKINVLLQKDGKNNVRYKVFTKYCRIRVSGIDDETDKKIDAIIDECIKNWVSKQGMQLGG